MRENIPNRIEKIKQPHSQPFKISPSVHEQYITTLKLTKPMYWTKSDQADSMVLHVVIAAAISFPGHFGTMTQTADDNECQNGKAKNARHNGYHNGFR